MTAITTTDHASLLASIQTQRATQPLSILTLAEPLLTTTDHTPSPQPAQHHDSKDPLLTTTTTTTNPPLNPTTLTADLTHYRDLFSKLRFSYLEQVTKEKYLRSIVGDPPVLVSHDQNLELEDRLVGMKADLRGRKEESEARVEVVRELAGRLGVGYERVNGGIRVLGEVPGEIEELQERVRGLREMVREREGEDEEMVMEDVDVCSLQGTVEAVEERRRRLLEVEDQIRTLQGAMPGKIAECERVDGELVGLEARRNEVTRLVGELRRRREEGGRDVLEDQGRWLRGEEAVLRGLLGFEVDVDG